MKYHRRWLFRPEVPTICTALVMLLLCAAPCEAATWYVKAAGPSKSGPADSCENTATNQHIQKAISATTDGDTVQIGAGTCNITYAIGMPPNKCITLQGAGTMPSFGAATSGGTTFSITSAMSQSRTYPAVSIPEVPRCKGNNHPTLANITFDVPKGAATPDNGKLVEISGRNFANTPTAGDRVTVAHHLTVRFHDSRTGHWYSTNTMRGLLYRLDVKNDVTWTPGPLSINNTGPTIRCSGADPYHRQAWASASIYGSAANQSNPDVLIIETSTFTNMASATDFDNGCKWVFRFNTLNDAVLSDHGFDSSVIGNRHGEVYGNTLTFPANTQWSIRAFYSSRGGTGRFFYNTLPRTAYGLSLTKFSSRIFALRLREPFADCYPGPGNIYASGGVPYPFPRQPGWGWSGSGDYHNQALEPIYVWGNTSSGGTLGDVDSYFPELETNNGACGFDNTSRTSPNYIVENREYYVYKSNFNGTSSPGGIGIGLRSNRPASSVNGLAYWSTDQGGNWHTTDGSSNDGCLDIVQRGAWVNCAYTPGTYPHPLATVTGGTSTP